MTRSSQLCGIVAEDDLILRIYEKNVRAVAIEIVYGGDLGNAIHVQIDDDAGREFCRSTYQIRLNTRRLRPLGFVQTLGFGSKAGESWASAKRSSSDST